MTSAPHFFLNDQRAKQSVRKLFRLTPSTPLLIQQLNPGPENQRLWRAKESSRMPLASLAHNVCLCCLKLFRSCSHALSLEVSDANKRTEKPHTWSFLEQLQSDMTISACQLYIFLFTFESTAFTRFTLLPLSNIIWMLRSTKGSTDLRHLGNTVCTWAPRGLL